MLVADSMFADLHQCYRQGFSFPDWCLTPEYEKVHSSFCKRVRLIGPKNGHRMAQCMIYQRQPVNIAMSTHGTNKAKFESFQTRYLTELSPCVPKVSLPCSVLCSPVLRNLIPDFYSASDSSSKASPQGVRATPPVWGCCCASLLPPLRLFISLEGNLCWVAHCWRSAARLPNCVGSVCCTLMH